VVGAFSQFVASNEKRMRTKEEEEEEEDTAFNYLLYSIFSPFKKRT